MDDDSSLANESASVEPLVIEVEVHDARGLDQDSELMADDLEQEHSFYYEASMQLVSSLTGEPIYECGVQWVRLWEGRRMSFMTRRVSPDKFVFGGVTATSLLAVRFDVFKKISSGRQPRTSRLIGVAEVTPWIIVKDDMEVDSRYCRWVRLVEDTTHLPGKRSIEKSTQGLFGARRRRTGGTSSLAAAARSRTATRTKRQRSELRISVTSRIGTGDALADAVATADAKMRWFLQPKPAVDPLNVVRVAVIRSSEVLSANAVVAARLSANIEEVDDPSVFFTSAGLNSSLAVTRPSSYGVWMQILELVVPSNLAHLHRDAFFVDIAIMHRVATGNGKHDGELLLRRAVVPMANVLSDDPCWIDFKPNVSLKLALRWDYDETVDPRESRPFFDCERFELKPPVPEVVGLKKKKKQRECNAVRVVLARARNPPPSILPPDQDGKVQTGRPLLTVGSRFYARVQLLLGGLNGLAPAPQYSTVATVGSDGTLAWNECFEFLFPQDSSVGQPSVRIDVVPLDEVFAGEEHVPGLAVTFEVPRNDVSRTWYDVLETDAEGSLTKVRGGAQILALGSRFYDSTLNQEDMRSIVTEALSFAFPEVDLSSIERVYDSTKDVADACVALSSLTASTDHDSDIESTTFVTSCNATDLAWAIQPITEEKEQDLEEDYQDADEASRMAAMGPSLDDRELSSAHLSSRVESRKQADWARQRRLIKSATAIMLTKGEAVKLIKDHPIGAVKIGIQNGDAPCAYAVDDGESSLSSSDSSSIRERRTLWLTPDERKNRAHKYRGRRTSVRVSSTLEDTSETIRSVSVIRIDVSVDRTPRDFVTLRNGLVAKLGQGESAIPALPKWIRKALRLKLKTQRVSVGTGVTAAAIAATVAIMTGVFPPMLIGPVSVGIGCVVYSPTARLSKSIALREIQKEIAHSTWLPEVADALARNNSAGADRINDAVLFFKQFMAHGAMCTMHQPPRRKNGSLGTLSNYQHDAVPLLHEETKDDSCTHGVDNLSLSSTASWSGGTKVARTRVRF